MKIINNGEWTHVAGYKYLATGVDRAGKRFRIMGDWRYISGINIWSGSKWLIDLEGRRHLICRCF